MAVPGRASAPRTRFGQGIFVGWALRAHFCLCRGKVDGGETEVNGALRDRLIALTEPLLGSLGYELVELEYGSGRSHATLRIFIDRPEGVGLEDCERASREVSSLLDVEDPIPVAFTLEVSSPGFDRVLRTRAHFERFAGERVHVELKAPREGRRRYTGTLRTVGEGGVTLEVDQEMVSVPFEDIGKARLAPADTVPKEHR
jgi:ribosome maturation factor RimP